MSSLVLVCALGETLITYHQHFLEMVTEKKYSSGTSMEKRFITELFIHLVV